MKNPKHYAKKNKMFQYAYDLGIHNSGLSMSNIKIKESTELITAEEAEALWIKYYPECIKRLKDEERPQMCIWTNCNSTTDYSEVEKEIDWRDDYEISGGEYYKVVKQITKIK